MNKSGGFLCIDKPLGMTSFDVIRRMRTIFACKKIGHAGTLDPQAEGLLILAFGRATRLIQFMPTEPKTYEFTIQFGTQTDSLDTAGIIVNSDGPIPEEDAVASVIPRFIGLQLQTPPAFSALKIKGVRAYSLARHGKHPELSARHITIHSLTLQHYDCQTARAQCVVVCSGGTYVRALARDIAMKLGTCGYAASIRRTACGTFALADAHRLEQVVESTALLSIRQIFADFPCLQADHAMVQQVLCGRNITIPRFLPDAGRHIMLFEGEELVAVCARVEGNVFHPSQVFFSLEGALHAAS